MRTHIIEATNHSQYNWGKFMVMQFDHEWQYRSKLPGAEECLLFRNIGMNSIAIWVIDLQTGEGAMFHPRPGTASYELNKHKIWVCPMFEPFLNWLYEQDLRDIITLPHFVHLGPDSDDFAEDRGYRRPGLTDVAELKHTSELMKVILPRLIQEFYDDPDGGVSLSVHHPDFKKEVAEQIETFRGVATELGLDYSLVLKENCSDFEIERIESIIGPEQ